jgi:hypothetical protein
MPVTVYGASDDLIEVEGDIREEFPCRDDSEDNLLAFSDGTVLRVAFDEDGIWRLTPVVTGSAALTHVFGQDDREHTDKATLDGDVRWVVYGSEMATKKADA